MSGEQENEMFYALNSPIANVPHYDILWVMGGRIANVGSNRPGKEKVKSSHGTEEKNGNGEQLIEMCQMNNLIMGGILFLHKKRTWR